MVALNVRDNRFVHKGDLLFKIDPGTFENAVTGAARELGRAKGKASYLDADTRRREQLTRLAVSDKIKEDALGIARSADASVI